MPPPPKVPHETTLQVLGETEGVVDKSTGAVSGPRHTSWITAASDERLEGLLSTDNLYTVVKQNRHGAYDAICEFQKIVSSTPTCDGSKDSSDEEAPVVTSFNVIIPPEVWSKIKPVAKVYKQRTHQVLPPYDWGGEIVRLLSSKPLKLPCPYSFKRASVKGPESDNYITFEALCTECGAEARGTVKTCPGEGKAATLLWEAPDTRGIHHEKKRRLQGAERVRIGRSVLSSSEWRKKEAAHTMDQGDAEPPTLYSQEVLRKAKQTTWDKDLKLPKFGTSVDRLRAMKHEAPWAGTIGDIGLDKFFVHYFSPAQLKVYNNACSSTYTILTIDATGQLVASLPTPHGRGGHIFLYEGVINDHGNQLPVVQMLSEKQDANSVLYWLNEWQRKGAQRPKEIVIDNSPALKSAIVRAFCGCADVADYKARCERVLEGDEAWLPLAFLRLDVAHLLSRAGKWSLWRDPLRKRLKPFYMRCIGYMISLKDDPVIKSTLRRVLLVATSPGSTPEVKECLSRLLLDISAEKECEEIEDDMQFSEDEDENGDVPSIRLLIETVKTKAQESNGTQDPNPYFLAKEVKPLEGLAMNYVLWSGVMVSPFRSPFDKASSAPSEGDFGDLKKKHFKRSSNSVKGTQICRYSHAEHRRIVSHYWGSPAPPLEHLER